MKINTGLLFLGLLVLGAMQSCAVPKPSFTFSGNQVAPSPLSFTNTTPKAESYKWDFGDGVTSTEASPSHRFFASGKYPVILSATLGKKTKTYKDIVEIKAPQKCLVMIETDQGNMLIQLSDATPQHRDNFLKLAEEGYFDGTLFHRVIKDFMIQGGDPNSKNAAPGQQLGMGGPNYTVPAEFVDSLVHVKGALAAARQGDQVNPQKRSSGSQFYIVHGREVTDAALNQIEAQKGFRYSTAQREAYKTQGGVPFLDRDYTVFGHILEGYEVLNKIAETATARGDRPVTDQKMKIRVIK
jgi:peptidyl-prolyl cis-trans isomerase B (cyclophilin B)